MKIEISIHQEAFSVMLFELSADSHSLCLHKVLTHTFMHIIDARSSRVSYPETTLVGLSSETSLKMF